MSAVGKVCTREDRIHGLGGLKPPRWSLRQSSARREAPICRLQLPPNFRYQETDLWNLPELPYLVFIWQVYFRSPQIYIWMMTARVVGGPKAPWLQTMCRSRTPETDDSTHGAIVAVKLRCCQHACVEKMAKRDPGMCVVWAVNAVVVVV
jgi:hypothetical protein